jgi:small subunit ribosomal protein S20
LLIGGNKKMAKLKTGRHTSAIKEVRKAAKKAEQNMKIKSKIRTSIKKLKASIKNTNTDDILKYLSEVFSELDKAAKKNIVHFNTASNQKSKLSKLVSKNKSP